MFYWQLSADNKLYYLEWALFIVMTIIHNALHYLMNICVFQHIAYAIIMPHSTVKGCCIIPDSLKHGVIAVKHSILCFVWMALFQNIVSYLHRELSSKVAL